MSTSHHEHGTMRAYVIGFILSLVFTFIPYYLVVSEAVSGMALLMTILTFGVLQMLVQIFFFLHLGRGPGPTWQQVFFVATVAAILIVVGGSIVIARNLHYNMKPTATEQSKKLINDEAIYQIGGEKTGACEGQYRNHQIVIENDTVQPARTLAQKCDTLTFINEDEAERIIGFGEHPNHETYAGETELIVLKGRNKTITLSEAGTYRFHDRLMPDTAGYFTVDE